jgi:hypothetical protein
MSVSAPEKKWTDHRLDDLNQKVGGGFARVDKDVGELRGEMNARFEKVEGKIDKLDGKFDKKFDRLTYCILGSAAGIITTLIGILAAVIGPNVF